MSAKPSPQGIAIMALHKYGLKVLQQAGIPETRALKILSLTDKARREQAEALVKELEKEQA